MNNQLKNKEMATPSSIGVSLCLKSPEQDADCTLDSKLHDRKILVFPALSSAHHHPCQTTVSFCAQAPVVSLLPLRSSPLQTGTSIQDQSRFPKNKLINSRSPVVNPVGRKPVNVNRINDISTHSYVAAGKPIYEAGQEEPMNKNDRKAVRFFRDLLTSCEEQTTNYFQLGEEAPYDQNYYPKENALQQNYEDLSITRNRAEHVAKLKYTFTQQQQTPPQENRKDRSLILTNQDSAPVSLPREDSIQLSTHITHSTMEQRHADTTCPAVGFCQMEVAQLTIAMDVDRNTDWSESSPQVNIIPHSGEVFAPEKGKSSPSQSEATMEHDHEDTVPLLENDPCPIVIMPQTDIDVQIDKSVERISGRSPYQTVMVHPNDKADPPDAETPTVLRPIVITPETENQDLALDLNMTGDYRESTAGDFIVRDCDAETVQVEIESDDSTPLFAIEDVFSLADIPNCDATWNQLVDDGTPSWHSTLETFCQKTMESQPPEDSCACKTSNKPPMLYQILVQDNPNAASIMPGIGNDKAVDLNVPNALGESFGTDVEQFWWIRDELDNRYLLKVPRTMHKWMTRANIAEWRLRMKFNITNGASLDNVSGSIKEFTNTAENSCCKSNLTEINHEEQTPPEFAAGNIVIQRVPDAPCNGNIVTCYEGTATFLARVELPICTTSTKIKSQTYISQIKENTGRYEVSVDTFDPEVSCDEEHGPVAESRNDCCICTESKQNQQSSCVSIPRTVMKKYPKPSVPAKPSNKNQIEGYPYRTVLSSISNKRTLNDEPKPTLVLLNICKQETKSLDTGPRRIPGKFRQREIQKKRQRKMKNLHGSASQQNQILDAELTVFDNKSSDSSEQIEAFKSAQQKKESEVKALKPPESSGNVKPLTSSQSEVWSAASRERIRRLKMLQQQRTVQVDKLRVKRYKLAT